ncbi:NAD(P)/FAD-dependent oxidoreductase [Cryobacterium gelidum]|uniref:FAD-binding oxidoreductase n=1 Tax=Cryobacterium gelidum TaxID=1259164 RepID=A0A4R9B061_9MICO|nr:FAD-dependent oxidoreductase [Cryobacterium gelidum]TFD72898.1 FAD-binding oxidoreductase [Cryobacterium gelidum]
MTNDVIIVGAGIIGAACARSLAAAGCDVTVVDRGTTAGGTSSACEGNLLVSDKGPGYELVLAQYASTLWKAAAVDLTEQLGPQFPSVEYEAKGGLVVATTEAGARVLLDFAASQRSAGVDACVLDADAAHELEPDLTPGITAAVHYPEDAQVQPTIATEALMASARRYGARLLENTPVTGAILDSAGALVGVKTPAGDLRASRVLIAAGPWSGDVAALLGVHLPVRPRRGELLVTSRMPHRIFHKVYDADYVGAVGSDDSALQTSSVIESTAGGTVLIGSSRQQVGFDARLRVDALSEIAAKALRLFPFLAGAAVIRSYGGFRPFMPDHLPVIGEDPRMPGLWHAAGHEGAGIGLSLATAELLTALMLKRPTHLDASPFSAARASLAPHLKAASYAI